MKLDEAQRETAQRMVQHVDDADFVHLDEGDRMWVSYFVSTGLSPEQRARLTKMMHAELVDFTSTWNSLALERFGEITPSALRHVRDEAFGIAPS